MARDGARRRRGKGRGARRAPPGPGPVRAPARPARALPVASGPPADDEPPDDSPRGQAEALVDEAFESDDPAEVVDLARRALERWPDAVDAHLLLSAHAPDAATARRHQREAVDAAERVLAAAGAPEPAGGPDLRAWVRARVELAESLLAEGGEAPLREARGHLEAVLFRAPDAPAEDGGGPRALLAACLLDLGDDAACRALLGAAPPRDAATTWAAWARVLLALRAGAPDEDLARAALERNPHVRAFLLGRRRLPTDLAGIVAPGEPLEAALVVLAQGAAWRATPGALERLARVGPAPEPAPKLPPKLRDRARELPQDPAEVWQLGFRRMPRWVEHEGERTRPWLGLAVEVGKRRIVAAEMSLEPPSHAQLLETLIAGVRRSREGPPRRPGRVEVRTEAERAALEAACRGLAVECAAAPLGAFDEVVEAKARKMAAEAGDAAGAFGTSAPARVAALARAAADLYRAAPWEALGDDVVLRVEAPALLPAPAHAVVLGAAGLAFGFVVAPRPEALRAVRDEALGPEAADSLALLFEDPSRLPLVDVDALERHGEVAAEDAYPWVFGVDAAGRPRPPSAGELDTLEAVARALPGVSPDSGARDVTIEVGGRSVVVRLAPGS